MSIIVLDSTTKSLKVNLSGAVANTNPSFVVTFADTTATAFTEASSDGVLNGTSNVTVVAAPAIATRRVIKNLIIKNNDTAAVTVNLFLDNNGTSRNIARVTLAVDDTWTLSGTFSSNGSLKQTLGTNNLDLTGTTSAQALTVSGATTLSAGTANGVLYLNGSKVATSGSALQFSGTYLQTLNGTGIQMQNSGATANWFFETSGLNLSFTSAQNGAAIWSINGSEQMRLNSTGLGIGTSSPGYKLDVAGAARSDSWIGRSNTSAPTADAFIYRPADNTVALGTANNERLRIDSSGNLLVGTTTAPSGASIGLSVVKGGGIQFGGATGGGGALVGNSGGGIQFYGYAGNQGAENYSERMRLDSSGNLGLGVTPSAWQQNFKAYEIAGAGSAVTSNGSNRIEIGTGAYVGASSYLYTVTGTAVSRYSQQSGVHSWSIAPSGTAGNAITFTQAMTLDASGNLEIGGTFAQGRRLNVDSSVDGYTVSLLQTGAYNSGKLSGTVYAGYYDGSSITDMASIRGGKENTTSGNYAGMLAFYTRPNGGSDTERARITSGGNLLVGATAASYGMRMRVDGGIASTGSVQFNIDGAAATDFEWVLRLGSGMRFYVNNASVLATLTSSGVWTNASDARYKENIRPVTYGLAEVMQLQPRAYNIIGSEKQEIGFVAQEVEPFIPELVESSRNSVTEEERLTLSYGQMSAVLVKAIQEQQALIAALTARIAALEGTQP